MGSMRWVVAAVISLAAGAANAASIEDGALTALDRIDRAQRDGRLTEAEHALLGVTLVRAPHELPDEFRPRADEPALRCGTDLMRRAFVLYQRGAFSEAQKKTYLRVGGTRPVLPNNMLVTDGTTDFGTVHYGNNAGDDVEAAAVATALQASWTAIVTTMGWRAPVPDSGAVANDPAANGGATAPIATILGPETWDDVAAFIVIEAGTVGIETFVAHELHHASQFAYDYQDGDFIYEATAVFIEDRVYDSADDYTFFIPPFQNNPARTLSYGVYTDTYMYGGAVFIHYLSDVHDSGGTALVRDVWDGLKDAGSDWFDGVVAETGLATMGAVNADFAGYRLLTGTRDSGQLEEGENLGNVKIEEAFTSIATLADGTTTDPPMGLGANFLVVTPSDAVDGDTVVLTITGDGSGPWFITGVGRPATGDATVTVFEGSEAEVPTAGFTEIGFAVTNAANEADGADVLSGTAHSVDTSTHSFSWTFTKGEEEAAGCGCTISGRGAPLGRGSILCGLLVGLALLVRRRDG